MKCSLLLIVATCFAVAAKCPLNLFLVLSSSDTQAQELSAANTSVLNYRKHTEILQKAAELAASEVNNCSNVLNEYLIELLPIIVPDSDPNHGVVEFVKEVVSESRNLLGIIGILDSTIANIILPLATHEGIDLIQLVDSTILNWDNSRQYSHTFAFCCSLDLSVRTASFMFQKLKWKRVGLVYSKTRYDSLYLRAAESFQSFVELMDIRVDVVHIDIKLNDTINSAVVSLQQSGVLAFLTLIPERVSIELICAVQQQGQEYAWVIVDSEEEEPKSNKTLICAVNNASVELTQLVLKIQQTPCTTNITVGGELSILKMSHLVGSIFDENLYSRVLYDSVWSLTLAFNASLERLSETNFALEDSGLRMNLTQVVEERLDFLGREGRINICRHPRTGHTLLYILQFQHGHYQHVGYFDSLTNNIVCNVTSIVPGVGPNITYTYYAFPNTLTLSLSAATGVLFLFMTLILLLFICFRNEPEVKASSFRLSLCMFLGCYLIICSALAIFVGNRYVLFAEGLRRLICNVYVYPLFAGVDLLLATLLAKLIRVWRVFTYFGKTGKIWSDKSLLLFVGLIVLGKIVLLAIWTATDVFKLRDIETLLSSDGIDFHYMIVQQCYSEHYIEWVSVVFVYSVTICIAVISVSIKTRKIKQENFKDTKKVSILISSILYMSAVGTSLWLILRSAGDRTASLVIIGMMYYFLCFFMEVLLFLPKIVPPLWRKLKLSK